MEFDENRIYNLMFANSSLKKKNIYLSLCEINDRSVAAPMYYFHYCNFNENKTRFFCFV